MTRLQVDIAACIFCRLLLKEIKQPGADKAPIIAIFIRTFYYGFIVLNAKSYYICRNQWIMNRSFIHKIQRYFAGQPVVKAWLFGSMSRGENNSQSDVDILVEFDPEANVGLFKHASMVMDLENILSRAVDLVTDGTLFPWVREQVEKDKILIYERKTA